MLANFITGYRIILSLIMVFVPSFSKAFYLVYLSAGFTDMIDGTVARRLGTASEFGAKLDTVADMFFVAAAAYKVLPFLEFSRGIWCWILLISVIKIINFIGVYVLHRRMVSVHSIANKVTGFMLFALPLTLEVVDIYYSSIAVCVIATLAAVDESRAVFYRI